MKELDEIREDTNVGNCRISPNGEIYYCKKGQNHESLAKELGEKLYKKQNIDREFLHNQGWIRRSNTVYKIDGNPLVTSYSQDGHRIELTNAQIKCIQQLLKTVNIETYARKEIANALKEENHDPVSAARERIFGPGNYS